MSSLNKDPWLGQGSSHLSLYLTVLFAGWLRWERCRDEDFLPPQADRYSLEQARDEPAALRGPAGRADPARAAERGGGPRRPGGGEQVSAAVFYHLG